MPDKIFIDDIRPNARGQKGWVDVNKLRMLADSSLNYGIDPVISVAHWMKESDGGNTSTNEFQIINKKELPPNSPYNQQVSTFIKHKLADAAAVAKKTPDPYYAIKAYKTGAGGIKNNDDYADRVLDIAKYNVQTNPDVMNIINIAKKANIYNQMIEKVKKMPFNTQTNMLPYAVSKSSTTEY